MPDDIELNINVNTTEGLQNVQKFADGLGALQKVVDGTAKGFVELDESGKPLKLQIQELTDDGRKMTRVFKDVEDEFKLVKVTLSQMTSETEKAAAAAKKLEDANAQLAKQAEDTAKKLKKADEDAVKAKKDAAKEIEKIMLDLARANDEIAKGSAKLAYDLDKARYFAVKENKERIQRFNEEVQARQEKADKAYDARLYDLDKARYFAVKENNARIEKLDEEKWAKQDKANKEAFRKSLELDKAFVLAHKENAKRDDRSSGPGFVDQLGGIGVGGTTLAGLATASGLATLGVTALTTASAALKAQFEDSVQEAIKFETILTRFKSVSGESAAQVDKFKEKIIGLSDSYGVKLTDVAAAAVDNFRHSVKGAADSTEGLDAALNLANITGEAVPGVVNAMGAAMDAAGLDVSQSGRLAAQALEVYSKGGISAAEALREVARTGIQAKAAGLGLEEAGRGLEILNRRGLTGRQAFTQYADALEALVKPSKEIQELIGASTGKEFIQAAGGLPEAFAEIAKRARETHKDFESLFAGGRGFRGAEALSEGVDQAIQKIDVLIKKFEEAGERAKNAPGKEFARFANTLGNTLANIADDAVLSIEKILDKVAKATNELSSKDKKVTDERTASRKFADIIENGLTFGLLDGLPALRDKITGKTKEVLQREAQDAQVLESKAAVDAAIAGGAKVQKPQTTAEAIGGDLHKRELETLKLADIQKQISKDQIDADKKVTENFKEQLEIRLHDAEKLGNAYEELAKKFKQDIVKNKDDTVKSANALGAQIFQENLARAGNQVQVAAAIRERLDTLVREAKNTQIDPLFDKSVERLGEAKNEDQLKAVAKEIEDKEKLGKEKRAEALGLINAQLIQAVEAEKKGLPPIISSNELYERRRLLIKASAEEQENVNKLLAEASERLTALAEKEKAKNKAANNDIRELARISDNEGPENKKLTPQELLNKFVGRKTSLLDELSGIDPDKFIQVKNILDQQQKHLEDRLGREQAITNLQAIRSEISAAIAATEREIEATTNKHSETYTQLVVKYEKLHQAAININNEFKNFGTNLATLPARAEAAAAALRGETKVPAAGGSTVADVAAKAAIAAAPALAQAAPGIAAKLDGGFDQSRDSVIQRLEASLGGRFRKTIEKSPNNAPYTYSRGGGEIFVGESQNPRFTDVNGFLDPRAAAKKVQESQGVAGTGDSDLQAYLERTQQQDIQSGVAGTADSDFEEWLKRRGIKHFSNGGFVPRGTDTVPAMLTPGEFVINREATAKFFPQLVALNAMRPIYRAEGGSVNIGDVHINVQGSEMPQETALSMARAFRREIRRGTLKWD